MGLQNDTFANFKGGKTKMIIKCDNCSSTFEDKFPHVVADTKVYCLSCSSQLLEEYASLVQNLGNATKEVLEDDATGDIRKDVASVVEWFHNADAVVGAIQEYCEARIEDLEDDQADLLGSVLDFIPTEDDKNDAENNEDEPNEGSDDRW